MALDNVIAVRAEGRDGIVIRGKERTSWLNGLVTCDLAKLGPKDGAYGLIVEKKGRIQTDFYLVQAEDRIALGVPRELRTQILETLDHYLIMEDAELEPLDDYVFWHLHGPNATKVAEAVAAPFTGTIDLLGAGGAMVALARADEGRIEEKVRVEGGAILDDAAWEKLRIERGLPRFGVEVDATLYPQEASLEKLAVSFNKGCYLGQEVVYMLENRGHVKRKLVSLDIEGDAGAPSSGTAVTTPEGVTVGDVKSSVVGAGKAHAIAMVKWAQTKPGTELRVGDRVARVRGGS